MWDVKWCEPRCIPLFIIIFPIVWSFFHRSFKIPLIFFTSIFQKQFPIISPCDWAINFPKQAGGDRRGGALFPRGLGPWAGLGCREAWTAWPGIPIGLEVFHGSSFQRPSGYVKIAGIGFKWGHVSSLNPLQGAWNGLTHIPLCSHVQGAEIWAKTESWKSWPVTIQKILPRLEMVKALKGLKSTIWRLILASRDSLSKRLLRFSCFTKISPIFSLIWVISVVVSVSRHQDINISTI